MKFKAKELWQDAEASINVILKFDNLATLNWISVGDARIQILRVDGENVKMTFERDDGTVLVSDQEIFDARIGGFSIRFTAIPFEVDKVLLNAGIVPLTKEDLNKKVNEVRIEMNTPRCPTLALKLHSIGSRSFNRLYVGLPFGQNVIH